MTDTENNRHTRLQKLSGSDFEIADGQPDIRGWDVKDATGKKLGEVDELIFDLQDRKVRYLVVDTGNNEYEIEDKEVLVPIGIAELHENDDDVRLPGVTSDQLRSLPVYDEKRFDTAHETSIRNVFGGLGSAALAGGSSKDEEFYGHEHFNEENLYRNRKASNESADETTIPVIKEELEVGKHQVKTGGVRLRSRIVERDVTQDVNLREESIQIERNPVDRAAAASDLREGEIELTEHAEVPVISKEARVVEEISLKKEVTERDETIRDTVRNTEVDVEKDDTFNSAKSNGKG